MKFKNMFPCLFKKKNPIVKDTISDVTTAGIPGTLISVLFNLPPHLSTIVTMALPALACYYNYDSRVKNAKVEEKEKEKLIKLIESLEAAMEERNIQELQHFVNLDFPTEVYCVVEEIIKESINAKGKWFRKFSSKIIITIGHDDNPDNLLGKQRCLEILKEVNEVDLQLLFLYELHRQYNTENIAGREEEIKCLVETIENEIIQNKDIYAFTLYFSAQKLHRLGLTMIECQLHPNDDGNNNKFEMIQNFISLNSRDVTPHYTEFLRYSNIFI
ncbi:hypothetical protein ACWKT7_23255 [Bacillus toyonensis]|uniref:hypothetical protein n=1 Tax=Bacillus cereus group sp. MG6 TaxID=3040246 RepID=UPI003394A35E